MLQKMKEEKVFKDPVHKYIYVQDRLIWDLINTKEFQRLRRIRQLGTTFYTFHAAEHSRFSHSLGVYEITRKIISQFERNGYEDWPHEQRAVCLCAALLHDLGHGPFSHSIEPIFAIDHERWSCDIIRGDSEIRQVLAKVSVDFPDQVAAVIDKTYESSIAVSLISSQLDADRMDYLLRDAYFTGVNYGTFDLERILRVLRPHQGKIVVKESGMHAVEDYLMARYQMHWQVYFHPVTRSSEVILRKIFQRAKQLYSDGFHFEFLPRPLSQLFEDRMTIDHYFMLDESFAQMVLHQWIDERDTILSELCSRFLHRRLFKYMSMAEKDERLIEKARNVLRRMGKDPEYYMEMDSPTDLSYDIYRVGQAESSQVHNKLPILIMDEQEQLYEISQQSEIVRSISGIKLGLHRLYMPADAIAALVATQ